MNTLLKRIISLVLCLVMVVGYVPVNAFADETGEAVSTEATEAPLVVADEGSEPDEPGKPADPKGPGKEEKPEKPGKPEHEKPGKPEHEKPGKPEHEKPGKPEAPKPEQETTPVTEETVPETTEATVPATEETVPETTEETVPEETEPVMMMMAAPKAAAYQVPSPYAEQGYTVADAAVIFTDLHTMKSGEDDEGSFGYKKDIIINMMTALKNTGLPFSSVTSGGDAFSVNDDDFYGCYTDTITGYIQSVLGNIPVNYVWSDHDRTAQNNATEKKMLNKKSHVAFENSNYYVYSLSMGDIGSFDRYDANFNSTDRAAAGFTATVDEAIAGFKAEVAKMDKTRPLLIVSHMPLFDKRNDNAFAEAWYDAISEVAKEMDVFFYYGHNHNHDTGNDYYYAKGSTMNVANKTNWNGYQTGSGSSYNKDIGYTQKTNMNFTHLGGGYMEPSSTSYPASQSSKTRQGTVLVTVLLQDAEGNEAVHLVTYSSSGEYTGNYALNTVVESVYEKRVTTPDQGGNEGGNQGGESGGTENPAAGELSQGGVTVKVSGLTGLTVATVEKPAALEGIFGADAVAYDISVEGFDNYSGIASVTVPVTGENAESFAVFHVDGDKLVQMPGQLSADGKSYTFTTAHFSVFVGGSIVAGAQLSGSYAETQGAMPASGASTDENNVTTITSGSYYALYNRTAKKDLSATASGNRLSFDSTNNYYNAWCITSAGNGDDSFYVQAPNGQYLTVGNGTAGLSNNPTALQLEYTSYTTTRPPRIYNVWDIASGNYHLNNYQGGGLTAAGYTNGASSDGGSGWYLYPMTMGTPGATVTFKLQNAADMVLGGAEPQDLTYEITMGDTTVANATIEWTSSDPTVVTVNNGVLTVNDDNKEGTPTITAKLTHVNGSKLSSDIVLTTTVNVVAKQIDRIELSNTTFTVFKGSVPDKRVGTIIVTYKDGTTANLPLTVGMLGVSDCSEVKTHTGLSLTYGGTTFSGITLNVVERTVDNYPEYPDEGAVKVNKTGSGIDFQSSGIAQIEVSASGVPVKRGVDVIVMLDTSSSMTRCIYCSKKPDKHSNSSCSNGEYKSRLSELNEALDDMIDIFGAKNEDGTFKHDIRIAIRDFNGAVGGATARDSADRTQDADGLYGAASLTEFTGSGLGADAFVDVATNYQALKGITVQTTASGTNYDYAFDAIYQLGQAVKAKNKTNGEERELFVIFMSDGAPNYYNYYGSQGGDSATSGSDDWNYWLTGAVGKSVTVVNSDGTTKTFNGTNVDLDDIVQNNRHYHFYYEETGNQHRMANAVKGDPETSYEIIRKATGLTGMASTGETNMYTVPGLGATMYSVAFTPANDGRIQKEAMLHVLRNIATSREKHYYEAEDSGALSQVFGSIASDIAYAANNARFVDQMGDNYNLQLSTSTYKLADGTTKTLAPVIEILSYDIYTRDDYLSNKCTENQIGARKGTSRLLEVVKFSADGKKAYSNIIDVDNDGVPGVTVTKDAQGNNVYTISDDNDNILADGTKDGYVKGVIYAQTFTYNTNVQGVAVNGVNIPTGTDANNLTTGTTNVLPSETFYWNLGTVQTSELAMRYYVYLEGSMEGTKPGGSYPTNNFATLFYNNYVNKPCYKETVSPVLAWKQANVSYAFYLVNEQGQVITNQTTGATGTFANKIAITNPVVYDEILLNNTDLIRALDVAAMGENVLPTYYTIYDADAEYAISIYSNGTGKWEIEQGENKVASTYVTNFGTRAQYSNELTNENDGDDYTHTVVWFAVVWNVAAHPDTVVIDYGLPVDISVLSNDMFGAYGKLDSIGAYSSSLNLNGHTPTLAAGFGNAYTGTYGTATADTSTGKVRYTLNQSNGMQMSTYEQFAYAVNYIGDNPGYYYDTITVIPATTIYYEDSFLTYTAVNTTWEDEGTAVQNAMQGEDRPGKYSLSDANHIYGFDNVNLGMSTYSLGTAKKVRVDNDSYATASFNFTGTGFDVVSMTNNDTGLLVVEVYQGNNLVKSFSVDNYYGYTSKCYNVKYTYSAPYWVEKVQNTQLKPATLTELPTDAPADDNNRIENCVITENGKYFVADYVYDPETAEWSIDEDTKTTWTPTEKQVVMSNLPVGPQNNTVELANGQKLTYNPNLYNKYTVTYMDKTTGYVVKSWKETSEGVIKVVNFQYVDGKWKEEKGTEIEGGPTTAQVQLPENPTNGQTVNTWKLYFEPAINGKAMYQVPVIQVNDLAYNNYRVVLTATYADVFDHKPDNTYDGYYLYLDAIRIYDPANDGAADGTEDKTIEDAYVIDGEGWPSYIELRDKLIAANSFDNVANDALTTDMEGLVFIDGDEKVGDIQISDYISYGPNNEVYLAPGQRVAFLLSNVTDNVAGIHIGIKSANGEKGTYTITNIARQDSSDNKVKAGNYYNPRTFSINTTTDMYYDMTDWKNDIIVISNTGNREENNTTGILSLTNIKATYKSNPNGTVLTGEDVTNNGIMVASAMDVTSGNEVNVYMTPRAAMLTLRALNAPAEEDVPEETVPEETVPEETVPVKPDSSDLKEAVDAAKDLKEKDYTKDSYKAVKSALKAAEKVLKDKKADQAKIEAALEALNDAIAALEAKPDNSDLKAVVKDAKKLKEKDYTKDSYKAVKSALKAAEKVLKDKKASQAKINEALAELNEAVNALEANAPKAKPGKKK